MNGERITCDTKKDADHELKKMIFNDKPTMVFCPMANQMCRKDCVCFIPPKQLTAKGSDVWYIYDSLCYNVALVGE